jgi:hypothetical protein
MNEERTRKCLRQMEHIRNQGFLLVKLKSSIRKCYGRHHDLVYLYGVSVSQMTTDMFCFVIITVRLLVKTHKYINRQNQSTTGKLWNRNDPDLVQAFLKKWRVESDFKAPNLPFSLRLKGCESTFLRGYQISWFKKGINQCCCDCDCCLVSTQQFFSYIMARTN